MNQDSSLILDIGNNQTLVLPQRTTLLGGIRISRKFSQADTHPYLAVQWNREDIAIFDYKKKTNSYFREHVEVPAHWAPNAIKITASKYLFGSSPQDATYEDSFKHVFDRIANTYTVWGWKHGYFQEQEDARLFNWEMKAMLVQQIWAPNSPVWFNVGHWEQWRWGRVDLRPSLKNKGNKAFKAIVSDGNLHALEIDNVYEHPQASACFLTEVADNMEAILFHGVTEGRIFASGSGVGLNLSTLRSSKESVGGKGVSSGPIAFDKGWDRMAGAIKSGGKTRRAARMVLLDSNHPDIFAFLSSKMEQESVAKIVLQEHNTAIGLKKIAAATLSSKSATASEKTVAGILDSLPLSTLDTYGGGMDDTIYGETIAHQNANHSVSLLADFWKAFETQAVYCTRKVTDPDEIVTKFPAEDLLRAMANACWSNAEPGCHNNDIINIWSPYKDICRITTSNPCVTGDSLVAGKGMRTIKSLVGQTPEVVSSDNEIHQSSWVVCNGVQPIYRVSTVNGYSVDATLAHQIPLANYGDTSVKDIRDSLVKGRSMSVSLVGSKFGNERCSNSVAYLAGRLVGEQKSILPDNSRCVTLGTKDISAASFLVASLIADESLFATKVNFIKKVDSKTSLFIRSSQTNSDLTTLVSDTDEGVSFTPTALSLAHYETKCLLAGFLSGYMLAEKKGVWNPCIKKALKDIHILLLAFGIKSNLITNADGSQSLKLSKSAWRYLLKTIPLRTQVSSHNKQATEMPFDSNLSDLIVSVVPVGEQEVFDLSEPETRHFVANGILIHNCSEYLAPNNTSCNLSSFNVYRFFDKETREVDVDALACGTLLAMIAADLNIEEGGFPTPEMAVGTYSHRTTGIGYANLGGALMAMGIPYDSNEGRFFASQLVSALSGLCWKASALLGSTFGGFHSFPQISKELQKIIALHVASQRLAVKIPDVCSGACNQDTAVDLAVKGLSLPSFEGIHGKEIVKLQLGAYNTNAALNSVTITSGVNLASKVTAIWESLLTAKIFRNSFVTCIAPTGCLVGSSLVRTNRGIVRLAKIGNPMGTQIQPLALTVQTDTEEDTATFFFMNGYAPTRRIVTAFGYSTQGTNGHQIKVIEPATGRRLWRKLDEVDIADIVPLSLGETLGHPTPIWLPTPIAHEKNEALHFPSLLTEQVAEFVGLFLTYGTLTENGVRLDIHDSVAPPSEIAELINSVFHSTCDVQETTTGATFIAIDSPCIAAWINYCGFAAFDYGKHQRFHHVPDAILASNDPVIYRGWLRGLFHGKLVIKARDIQFLQDTQQILLILGIPSRIKPQGHNSHRLMINGAGGVDRFTAFIDGQDISGVELDSSVYVPVETWILQGLVVLPSHKSTLARAFHKGRITRSVAKQLVAIDSTSEASLELQDRLRFFYDSVVSNAPQSVEMTYDLTVPKTNTYIANGFITHNTISAPLGVFDQGTTSAEPDYSLVKSKSLAGGGHLRMFNTLALQALKALRYSDDLVLEAALEVAGAGALIDACDMSFTAAATHLAKRPTWAHGPIRKLFENSVEGDRYSFALRLCTDIAANTNTYIPQPIIEGTSHVEHIPWLNPEHLAVFDCATTATGGTRSIAPSGHVQMLAAIQPFISGAISKTVNLPQTATRDDIFNAFVDARRMGVKCLALYRDGSKGISVFQQSQNAESLKWDIDNIWASATASCSNTINAIKEQAAKPKRNKLAGVRTGRIVKFDIGGQLDGFLIVGMYPDGRCGEVFGRLGQGGSFAHGMFESFCKAFSAMLQWGVPLNQAVHSFQNMAFDPSGFVKVGDNDTDSDIRSCKSAVDLMMRILQWLFPMTNNLKYLPQDNEAFNTSDISEIDTLIPHELPSISLSSAEMCPQCSSLSMIQDGKCKRCSSCGYSGGGCGG